MADVTSIPVPTNASPFDVPGDIKKVADAVGDQTRYSVANAAALPASGNWKGRLLMTEDTGLLYECTATPGTWVRLAYPVFAQAQGVIACPATAGGGSSPVFWSDSAAVVFPAGRFTQAPRVYVQTIGPAGVILLGGVVDSITTSGCSVRGLRIGAVPGAGYSVEWLAVQMAAGAADG